VCTGLLDEPYGTARRQVVAADEQPVQPAKPLIGFVFR
jgi:hypothetical protein